MVAAALGCSGDSNEGPSAGSGAGAGGTGATDAAAGEGGAATEAGTGSTASLDPEQVAKIAACVTYYIAACEKTVLCDYEVNRFTQGTVDDCLATVVHRCPRSLFGEGTTNTVEDVLSCAATWESTACPAGGGRIPTPDCYRAGTFADGTACSTGAQCTSRLCTAKFPDYCGVCAAGEPEGATCDDDIKSCGNGLHCSAVTGTCLARSRLATGAPCDPDKFECIDGVCLENDEGEHGCAPRMPDGASCTNGCEHICNQDTLLCEPYRQLGESCADGGWCDLQLYCDEDTRVCRALPKLGEACGPGVCEGDCNCEAPAFCSGSICAVAAAPGEVCSDTSICQGFSSLCEDGVCSEPTLLGPRYCQE